MVAVRSDFDCLIRRMRERLYPETMPALAFYWLKTVYHGGYQRDHWNALDILLGEALATDEAAGEPAPNDEWRQTLSDLRARVQNIEHMGTHRHEAHSPDAQRPAPNPDAFRPYVVRLLNEWLPVEVAHLLVEEPEPEDSPEPGIPVLGVARALERLLVREHLSAATLEALLDPGLFSPRFVYAADAEILRDVVLFLLGRTEAAAAAPVVPATLLGIATGAPLPANYGDAVERAFLVAGAFREELHVPIGSAQAVELLTHDRVRFTSIVATMDGRWWQADKLYTGDWNAVVYRPMGRLRIDYSNDHARLRIPWPESRFEWSGPVSFPATLELFGRQWRVAQWEQDAERAWLNLVFAGAVPVTEIAANADVRLRRSRPASVDMGWAALEGALLNSVNQNSLDAIEQMRRNELIPLGRALFGLAEATLNRRQRTPETIEARLRAVAYHGAELLPSYGRVPWRIVPERVQKALLERRLYTSVAELLHQVFDGLPETRTKAA
jgi:hypothetical protein